jgi:hypothetical protein
VLLLVPTLVPFTFHWYDGVVPPLVGVAVKVMGMPAQDGLVPEVTATATVGATDALTVMVMPLEVAVVGFAQEELEVITAVMMLLLANELEV